MLKKGAPERKTTRPSVQGISGKASMPEPEEETREASTPELKEGEDACEADERRG